MSDSSSLGDAIAKSARAAFHAARGRIEVPEWPVDDKPTVLFFKPLSIEEQFEIADYRRADGQMYGLARAIILKAEDADGKRLFTVEHEMTFLKGAVSGVVMRVAQAIIAGPKLEDVEKN